MPKHSRAKKKGKGPEPRGKHAVPDLIAESDNTHAAEGASGTQAHVPGIAQALLAFVLAGVLIAFFMVYNHNSNQVTEQQVQVVSAKAGSATDRPASEHGLDEKSNDQDDAVKDEAEDVESVSMADQLTRDSFADIAESAWLQSFSLNHALESPEPGTSLEKGVDEALQKIRDQGADCGFMFVNMDTGKGLAYNCGQRIYSASSIKAPYALYLLQTYGNDLGGYDRGNIQDSIIYSDNNAYNAMHLGHDGDAYLDWLEVHGIEREAAWQSYYPQVSAKQLAGMWVEIYHFTHSGTEDGTWLNSLLADTTVSFIRDGLEGTEAQVWNKAGWITDAQYGNAVNDAGIIEVNGRTYLMTIVTSQPTADVCHENVSSLARILFNARNILE